MNYKTSNTQTADSKDSRNTNARYNIWKTDAHGKKLFEKDFNDINQAVKECCECESTDKSAKARILQFENSEEGAKKAEQWLSQNNSKYNFNISSNQCNSANTNTLNPNAESKRNRDQEELKRVSDIGSNNSKDKNRVNQKQYEDSETNS
jgi:hypothetical protein